MKIFTDNIEESAMEQIRELLSISVFSDKKIRIKQVADIYQAKAVKHLTEGD